ncbi:adenylyltransferase/cytidyltransferase family protein [Streptococcus pyogenes]|uniref:adenylyltransferase/cytidyltransferase family protein n=1 Tax=Streptococcus pyogenes TaxID=1314 RepID=UPI003DA032F3
MKIRTVLTYGTFDLFHVGHLNLLRRLRGLGDRLVVGVSTDAFNELKGKKTIVSFSDRQEIVRGLKCVDEVFPEASWDQKVADIKRLDVSVFGMGSDWNGKFDSLREYCEVVYLDRTPGISSTELKRVLQILDREHVRELKSALDIISNIVERFE